MKNTFKKVVAVVLTVLMCVSIMTPALTAAQTCPGPNADHNVSNCVYTIYETVNPTCKDSGQTLAKCNACGTKFVAGTIAKTNAHDWDMPEAACKELENDKKPEKVCKVCEATEPVATADHTWTAWTLTGVAACKVGENVRRTCTVCKKEESRKISDEGHYFELFAYTAPIACNAPGSATYLCVIKGCGATKTVEIEATADAHTYVSWNEYYKGYKNAPEDPNYVDSTCAKPGTMTVVCKDCARTAVIAINTLKDHVWRAPIEAAVAATCDKSGKASYTLCLNCRVYAVLSVSDEIVAADFNDSNKYINILVSNTTYKAILTDKADDLVVSPLHVTSAVVYGGLSNTCTTAGKRLVRCPLPEADNCGWFAEIEIKPAGKHVFYPDVTDKDAQDKIMEDLQITGIVEWKDLDIFDLTHDTDAVKAAKAKIWKNFEKADCENDATVEWICLNCLENFDNGHTFVQDTEIKKATPEGSDFVKKGHNYPQVCDITSATCVAPGIETFYCDNDGCTIPKVVRVNANGHDLVADPDKTDVAATCTTAGTKYVKCKNCTYTETIDLAIDSEAHKYTFYEGSAWAGPYELDEIPDRFKASCVEDKTVICMCVRTDCAEFEVQKTVKLDKIADHVYMDLTDAKIAKKLAALKAADDPSTSEKDNEYDDSATESKAVCTKLGGCENGTKYTIYCGNCAMFKSYEVTEGFGGGHVKVYINGTATAATPTAPEYSNKWYCKNSYCEFYFETYDEAVTDMNDNNADPDHSVSKDFVAAPHHYAAWDDVKTSNNKVITYKDVPTVLDAAVKDANNFDAAKAIEAPVDAKGNVTRYVAIPGTSLIWVYKYTAKDHTEATVTTGGFYCTECIYNGSDKAVYTEGRDHSFADSSNDTTVTASCKTYGYTLEVCDENDGCFFAKQTGYAPVADHNEVKKNGLPATCILTGFELYECQDCGLVKTVHLEAEGHNTAANWAGQTITTSCQDRASTRLCAVCNVTVPMLHVGAVGTKCTVCTVVIPAN